MKMYVVRWLHDHAPTGDAKRLVKAFSDPTKAEDYRRRLERGQTAPLPTANPLNGLAGHRGDHTVDEIGATSLADLTSMPESVFTDWLRDAALDPPLPGSECSRWPKWYKEQSPAMTDAQRARVWQALDKLRFFETIEVELEA